MMPFVLLALAGATKPQEAQEVASTPTPTPPPPPEYDGGPTGREARVLAAKLELLEAELKLDAWQLSPATREPRNRQERRAARRAERGAR